MNCLRIITVAVIVTANLLVPAAFAKENTKTAELVVNVHEVNNNIGKIRVMLFESKEGFPNETDNTSSILIDAAEGSVAVRYTGVPYGKYAVYVIHDEDEDNKLTAGFFGAYEGRAFSNDQKVSLFGDVPEFDKTAFEIKDPKKEISVKMSY